MLEFNEVLGFYFMKNLLLLPSNMQLRPRRIAGGFAGLATFVLSLAFCGAELRKFEDRFGREIEANLVSHEGVDSGRVTIRKADGKEYNVELNTFSKKDQQIIQKWMESAGLKLPARFGSLRDGMLVRYGFDRVDSKSAKDDSGNGHEAELIGSPKQVDGVVGKALSFDGLTQHMRLKPAVLSGKNTFSISFWARTKESRAGSRRWLNPTLFGQDEKDGGDMMVYTNRGRLGMFQRLGRAGNVRSDVVISGNKWHHIVVVCNPANTIRLYLDSDELLSMHAGGRGLNDTAFALGAQGRPSTVRCRHHCEADELMIWDRPLSDAEIRGLYLLHYRRSATP